jgi:murein peptide amidase A
VLRAEGEQDRSRNGDCSCLSVGERPPLAVQPFGMSSTDPAGAIGAAEAAVQRLGRNLGRYLGETINVTAVLAEIESLARTRGWERECFLKREDVCLMAYHLPVPRPRQRLYVSAGIHGDEPAGPLAAVELMRTHDWPRDIEIWLCPCLNPTGFPLNSRENASGVDLNRQYLNPQAEEVRSHIAWLDRQPRFDISLCLHEDWEAHGFYVYELSMDTQPSYAQEIVRRVAKVCPIDRSPVIEGREASDGIIRPHADLTARPDWPEAFYLIQKKTWLSCTLEAPSDFPLSIRVAALAEGVRAVLERL